MIEGIPNWLSIPAFIIAVLVGNGFLGWLAEEFRLNKRL